MRKALIVGINNYPGNPLTGCVNDATKIEKILSRNYDCSLNFSCKLLSGPPENITRSLLRQNITDLFSQDVEVALLYFSGHGTANNLGGYLVTQDATRFDEGVSMTEVLTLAHQSRAHEIIIILDCCHSGAYGQVPVINNENAILREGISVLTASRGSEAAVEIGGEGLFTFLVCDALVGGAADIVGDITVASIYAYVDQALGPWDQRPLFKSHVSKLIKIRRAKPSIDSAILRHLPEIFLSQNDEKKLDPSYEHTSNNQVEENVKIFEYLQQYNRNGLVEPVGEKDMYFVAIHSKSCKLTQKGKHYWRVVSSNLI